MAIDGLLHEQGTIRAFIQKPRQERAFFLLSQKNRRRDFTDQLAHFKWLDEQFMHPIPSTTAHTAAEYVALLRKMGAGPTVWVISEIASIDAREINLEEVMGRVWGACRGTILSCVPGKLAFFRGEEMKSERLLIRN